MAVSQNGYKACDSSLIGKYTIPGSAITINLRKGDVSVVLLDYFGWHHAEIEPLHQEDTGGYNCRTISGSAVKSNHSSGTAGDVRWKIHVRGKRNAGFSAGQIRKINAKLKEYGGVIRWGNNYSSASIPDPMHFEINAGPAAVKKQADRIRAKGKEGNVTTKDDLMDAMTQWWADAYAAANGEASGTSTDDRRKRNYRDFVRKVTGGPVDQGAILTAIAAGAGVSAQELADALRPGLAADIVAGLPEGALTQDQVEEAVKAALRSGVGA
jgi:D-alanyl-D-alanine carboxypeptidase-like protein